MPARDKRFTVLVPDTRGYDGLAIKEDLRHLLQAYGHRQALMVGHDMGAPVALLRAAHRPDEAIGGGYFDEPLRGVNLERFTAFRGGDAEHLRHDIEPAATRHEGPRASSAARVTQP